MSDWLDDLEATGGITEWGTDFWGNVMSEPSEEHARKVAEAPGCFLYSRAAGGPWVAAE